MDLYLIRHAQAASLVDAGVIDDANRPLTDEGKAQAKAVGACFHRRGITPEAFLTSPLIRARQTADGIVASWPGSGPELRVCDELAPGGKRRRLARYLKELGMEKVALVGHQPDLGEFSGWLIGSKKAEIEIDKAGVAYIRCDERVGKGEGMLKWLVTTEWFDA